MSKLPFPYVTIAADEAGNTKNIASVGEAALWLIEHWSQRGSDKFEAAKRACLDALDGKMTCTDCREAFIEAAKEAGIYITHQRL
ncbi:DUF982 domain-containing protein [Candidatus Phyllobacterium onerii]|uniref:DUF982 domain-containing protein n=1 Tax=Candidatus Phyllobacterium onerii TaxID=3020828 RepID=UPI00232F2460|nr:DUF982 domain-containing protein [Phyllobacterium sp. IY22]